MEFCYGELYSGMNFDYNPIIDNYAMYNLYIGYFSNYVRSLTHIMHKISYKINMLQSILIMKANIYFIYKKYNM